MRVNSQFTIAIARVHDRALAHRIARLAVKSLYAELVLYPKPGLVSLHDSGAHADMDAASFIRSLFALRTYFVDIASAGMRGAPFAELRALGIAAEARMLAATRGVNTHRGAIFVLGLLGAAAGYVCGKTGSPTDTHLQETIGIWRRALITAPAIYGADPSHGRWVASRYGVGGARDEAAQGFPTVFGIALPALREALGRGADAERTQLHTLFTLLSRVADTNVLYRGGKAGLNFVQRNAKHFLNRGGVFAPDWRQRAEAMHHQCSARRLSPGGCADLLCASWFVHRLQTNAQ